jgi:hypothetical protein
MSYLGGTTINTSKGNLSKKVGLGISASNKKIRSPYDNSATGDKVGKKGTVNPVK